MSRRLGLIIFSVFALIVVALWIKVSSTLLDPDFGWHLRMGQVIVTRGIPYTDLFSYSMPNFPYVDHAWLSDVFISQMYSLAGFFGLAVFFSIVTFFPFALFWFSAPKPKEGRVFAWILGATIFLSFLFVRPVIFTWVLFSLVFWIVIEKKRFKKWRLVLPMIFVLWANLHGGFVAGLFCLLCAITIKSWKQKKIELIDIFVFAASVLVTLINPYGTGLWREVGSTLSSQILKTTIAEWQTSIWKFNPSFLMLETVSLIFILRYWSKLGFLLSFLNMFFFVSALTSVRNVPISTLVALPTIGYGINFFYQEVKTKKDGIRRFRTASYFLTFFALVLFAVSLMFIKTDNLLTEENFYPQGAVSYLRKKLPSGNVFSTYDWGGYLIWKFPEKKVFVDGRMAIWMLNGQSAFEEYLGVGKGNEEAQKVFQKYNVDMVLWPTKKNSPPSLLEEKLESFLPKSWKPNTVFSDFPGSGWEKIYEDPVATIFKRLN